MLLVVDYFSWYCTWKYVVKLTSTYSGSIFHLKTIFSRLGIPDFMVSDNGPQFASSEMKTFAVSYKFEQGTYVRSYGDALPAVLYRYPQGNGLAERTVQTIKKMLTAKVSTSTVFTFVIRVCYPYITSNIHIRSLPYSMYIIIIGL